MKKKPETAEEIAEKLRVKKINSESRKLTTVIKNNCSSIGLRAMRLQLDWLKSNETALPSAHLNRQQTIDSWSSGIAQYESKINGTV